MKQLRTVAAVSAITLVMVAAPTFAEHPSDTQGRTGVTGGQTPPTLATEKDELVARVEAALRADPALVNATNLVVLSAGNGKVTLSGYVYTNAQAARALRVAGYVAGVKRIEDKLVRDSEAHVSATPLQSTTVGPPLAERHPGKAK